ncbi:MAG: FAD-dependent oxidoreductase, partial [Clostridia bacterium]|nr:FAD-dependent oxidoreductase [Clostridia bacterium]
PAAVAVARQGARTLLISGRPVIGGNASGEAGVGFNGASARQVNAREGGIAEEIVRTHFHRQQSWQTVLENLCAAEENLTVITGWFVCGAEMKNERIHAVIAENIFDNRRIRVTGRQFIDCTGDGWLGYHAGAKYHLGREARWQYDEEFAPEAADTLTMSGCTMRGYGLENVPPLYVRTDHEVRFDAPAWVPKFPAGRGYGRNIENIGFAWWLEAPNSYDDIYDAEMARDELMRIQLGHYNYLKNLWENRDEAKNYALMFMPYYDAKRESRRFIGDYVLTQNDCMNGVDFPDTVAHTGWPIDLHNPKGIYSGTEGPFFSNTHIPLVKVPYRCLYSQNIANLQFAGRCVSVSHIALGTARVQNTIACMGQAVGTAAAMCVRLDTDPRGLCAGHLDAFRQQLLKDDQYIPGLCNADPNDIALQASVTASSEKKGELYYPHIGEEVEGYELDRQRATFFARDVSDDIGSVWTKLINKTDSDAVVSFHVRLQADPDGYTTEKDSRVIEVRVPAASEGWFELPINIRTKLRYLWLWADRTPGIWWPVWRSSALDHTRSERLNAGETFPNIRYETHCVLLEKPAIEMADCSCSNVINGYSRMHDAAHYEWVSDPSQGLPQWIALSLSTPRVIGSIALTFDTDMTNPSLLRPFEAFPHTLVTDYTVELFDGARWIEVVRESGNYLRHRVHAIRPNTAEKVRVTVLDSGDHTTARLFEIRLYE